MFAGAPRSRRRSVSEAETECTREREGFTEVCRAGVDRLQLFVVSVQRGDRPDYEGMLELFPKNYHEPYYESYIREDFGELGATCDLTYIRTVNAFVSKVMVFDKPFANPMRA